MAGHIIFLIIVKLVQIVYLNDITTEVETVMWSQKIRIYVKSKKNIINTIVATFFVLIIIKLGQHVGLDIRVTFRTGSSGGQKLCH
jgi:hypothetical protein